MCGIAGIFNKDNASFGVAEALFAEQHRGQDSAGLVSSDGSSLHGHFGLGLVKDTFSQEKLKSLPGPMAIGHVRYPTQGPVSLCNCQPHIFSLEGREIFALASNGDITNLPELTAEIEKEGFALQGDNDAEVMAKFIGIMAFHRKMGLVEAVYLWMEKALGA